MESHLIKNSYLINVYFFIVQHAYRKFIQKLKGRVKRKKLKYLIKMFKCRIFFRKIKNIVSLIKKPNGGRITSSHAYLFYFRNLKEKFIRSLKLNIKRNKFYTNRTLLLFGIRNKISIMFLFREMKKIHNSKLFDKKTGNFYKEIFFRKIKKETKENIKFEEIFRQLRRYQYINNLKYIMKRFNPHYCGLLKIISNTKLIEKKFLIKKTIKVLKNFAQIKHKINQKKQEQFALVKQSFLRRVRHRITNKILLKKNLNILIRRIKKYFNFRTMRLLKKLNFMSKVQKSEKIKYFYLNIGLKLFKKHINIKNQMIKKDNILMNNSKKIKYMNIRYLIKNVKEYITYHQKKKQSILFFKWKIEKKILNVLKNNVKYHIDIIDYKSNNISKINKINKINNITGSELQELKSLRNKKRAAPVIINFDNL